MADNCEDMPQMPQRPVDAHKGTFGTLAVVGGSEGMIGAPALVARGALRTGVGLVKFVCDAQLLTPLILLEPSATGRVYLEDVTREAWELDRQVAPRGAVVIGPGWSNTTRRHQQLASMIKVPRPLLLDADGLNVLASSAETVETLRTRKASTVLTPHPGEATRLASAVRIAPPGQTHDSRVRCAQALAVAYGATVVLKGARSVITDGESVYVNETGHPCMATAGSGDVLSGVIGALLARGIDALDAVRLGVYYHGKAGEQWANRHGQCGMLARELADELPDCFKQLA